MRVTHCHFSLIMSTKASAGSLEKAEEDLPFVKISGTRTLEKEKKYVVSITVFIEFSLWPNLNNLNLICWIDVNVEFCKGILIYEQ